MPWKRVFLYVHAGNLNGIYYDHLTPVAVPLHVSLPNCTNPEQTELHASSLFGPTW